MTIPSTFIWLLIGLIGGLVAGFALGLPTVGWSLASAGVAAFLGGEAVRAATRSMLNWKPSDDEALAVDREDARRAFGALTDGLDVGIFVCDARGMVRFANPQAREMFRFEQPENKTLLAITLSYDMESLMHRAIDEDEVVTAELIFAYPSERTAVVRAWPGANDTVVLAVRETTELRRLERIRQDFVANVSHELRTPLSTIRAMAETLIDETEGAVEIVPRYLHRITDEVDRLALISNDLLILSSAESNPVRKQACDIALVVRSAITQLELKAKEKGLQLEYSGPQSLVIQANTAQMSQVASNLVDNAINYTNQGGVSVIVKDQADTVLIRVEDTGVGIASEDIPRIFERFYRADKGRSRATGGTGLGLSIVKHIVEAHGGTIEVESMLNRGSTFRAVLPKGSLTLADQNT